MTIAHKCYACHGTAQVPVTAALVLKELHGISGDEVDSIVVAGSDKLVSHHNLTEPQELATAQYSAPFCVALAFYRDPRDPNVFCDASVADPAIRTLCRKVKIEVLDRIPADRSKACRVSVRLKDGREFAQDAHSYPGLPEEPLSNSELQAKFHVLTASMPNAAAERIFSQLLGLEDVTDVGRLRFD